MTPDEQALADQDKENALSVLQNFNTNELNGSISQARLMDIANHAHAWCNQVREVEELTPEMVESLLLLTLYDVILLVDDSASMRRDEYPQRIDQLKMVGGEIVRVNSVVREADRPSTVEIHFLNRSDTITVKTRDEFMTEAAKFRYGGWTMIGTALRSKILDPKVRSPDPIVTQRLKERPLLISIITDGKPEGEDPDQLKRELKSCRAFLHSNPDFGNRSVVFQISQVGNDRDAQKFLHKLENDKELKDIIDCTSNSDLEINRRQVGSRRTMIESTRTIKMLAGALLVNFDEYHNEEWVMDDS